MAVALTPDDLTLFVPNLNEDLAQAMIDDALALAATIAPCILGDGLTETAEKAVKAVIRGAILRWHEGGSGLYMQQQAGPFQVTTDNRQTRKAMFWPSEIDQLQAICKDAPSDAVSITQPGL